jgi:DNA transformation protein
MPKKKSGLGQLKNIGPTVERRLNEVGIHTRADLERVGPAEAYKRIRARHMVGTTPKCYYLYSLQGALTGVHWDDLPESVKEELSRAVEA